jgi:hypothetical protein
MPFVLNDPTQTSPEIHVGDVGTQFISTVYNQDSSVLDVSPATTITFRIESPSNVSLDVVGSLYTDGTDGKVLYTNTDIFDESGTWFYQVILVFPSGTWSTNVVPFTVYSNLVAP